jgi:hypothetical protein
VGLVGKVLSWCKRVVARYRTVLGLVGGLLVAVLLGFMVFMYPTTFVDAWNGVVGVSWSSNHTLTIYIYAHCYPYYPLSSQCFARFGVVSVHLVNGSCTLEYVISAVARWTNETVLTYHCATKPTAVVINATCGTTYISNYSIVITNETAFTPFMC